MIPLWVRSLGRLLLSVGGQAALGALGPQTPDLLLPDLGKGCLQGVGMELWFWFILEEGTYDEYENDLGITAIALYDYQAGEKPLAGQKEGWRGCGTEGFQRLLSRELGLSECYLQFLRRIYI